MTDDDLDVKEEISEAGQISELNKEIQKLQEQINTLNLRKDLPTWQIRLLWVTITLCFVSLPANIYIAIIFIGTLLT